MGTPPAHTIDENKMYRATIATAKGDIVMDLDPQLAPKTVNNFVSLARDGYYDGLTFHRVVDGFVVQGGCPEGTGTGGPGYKFEDEKVRLPYALGSVAMANAGPNTNGSQFFICTGQQSLSLPPQYNLFGQVVAGFDIAQKVQVGDVMTTVAIEERDRD
ncbi:MAG: peptidylprolyl isomerase [Acidimicrobiia bacterium]